jgi:glucose-1-phosphate thymidylyltransferase
LILGDNIFYGHGLGDHLLKARSRKRGATIFGYTIDAPQRYRSRRLVAQEPRSGAG